VMIAALIVTAVLQHSTLLAPAPKNAVVLFDGKDTSAWVQGDSSPCKWNIVDGVLEVNTESDSIHTKQEFGDYHLHLEFWLPKMLDKTSQGRANSGCYQHGRYEVQILDSYENPTYKFGGVGAIYAQKDPDKNAVQPPETWNTYDIDFKAPRFDKDGKLTAQPIITVFHNGIRIHNKVAIKNQYSDEAMKGQPADKLKTGPILLQNHGCKIRFRNIWIQPKK